MKKVKEYLDSICECIGKSTIELKDNGHYCVHGSWYYYPRYPKKIFPMIKYRKYRKNKSIDTAFIDAGHLIININNETIMVGNMRAGAQWSKYHYLQTYEHIPREEPDENGYYKRSTEEEIIQYIDTYYTKIKNIERDGKVDI